MLCSVLEVCSGNRLLQLIFWPLFPCLRGQQTSSCVIFSVTEGALIKWFPLDLWMLLKLLSFETNKADRELIQLSWKRVKIGFRWGRYDFPPCQRMMLICLLSSHSQIVVSLVNGRPGAMNFSYSPLLRNFTKATNIRLRFLQTNTLLGHLMGKALRDPTVTRRVRQALIAFNELEVLEG